MASERRAVACVDLASLLTCEPHAECASRAPAAAASFSFAIPTAAAQQCWAEARQPAATGPELRAPDEPRQVVCRAWLRPGVRRLLTALQPHYHTALLVRACCCCYSGPCSSASGCGVSGISSSSSARGYSRAGGHAAGSSDCGSAGTSASGDRSLRSSYSSTGRSSSGGGAPHASSPGGSLRGCGCGGFGYGVGADPTEFVTALLGVALPALDPDGTLLGDRVFVVVGARETPALQLLSGASPLAVATSISAVLASSPRGSPSTCSSHTPAAGRAFSTLHDLHALAGALTARQQHPQQPEATAPGAGGPSAAAAVVVVTTADRFMFGPLIDHVIECQPYRAEYGMYDDVLDSLATALCGPDGAAALVKGGAAAVAAALRRCGLAPGRLQPSPVMQALRAQLAIKAATAASASSRGTTTSSSSSGGAGSSGNGGGTGAAGGGRDPRAMARLVEVLAAAAAAADPLRAIRQSQQQSNRGPQPRGCRSAGGAAQQQQPRSASASERRSGSGNQVDLAREDLRLQHMPKPLRPLGGRVSRSTGDLATVSSAPGALVSHTSRSGGSGSGSGGGSGLLRERRSGGRRSSSPPPQFYLPPIPEQPLLEHLGEPGTASCPASPSRCASGALTLALVPPDPALAVAATAAAAAAAAALSGSHRAPKAAGGAPAAAQTGATAGRWALDVNSLHLRDVSPSVAQLPVVLALPTACGSAPPSDTASVCTPKSRATTAATLPSPPLSPISPLSPLALASPVSGSRLGGAAGAAGRSGRSIGSSFTSALAAAAAMLPSVGSSGSSVHGRSGAGRTELESRPKSFPSALKPPAARFATASSSSRVFPGSRPGSASGPSLTGAGSRGRPASLTAAAALPGMGSGGAGAGAANGSASPVASISAAASALRVATSRLWSRLLGGSSRKSRASRSSSTAAASPVATPTAALAAQLGAGSADGSGSNPFSMGPGGAAAAAAVAVAVDGGGCDAGSGGPVDVFLPPSPFSSRRVQEDCAPAVAAACVAAAAAAASVCDAGSVAATVSAPMPALSAASSGAACASPQLRALDQPLASAPAAVSTPATPQASAAAEPLPAPPAVIPISRRDAALASEALFVASHIDEVLASALSEAEGVPHSAAASLVASVERTSVFVERSSSGGCGDSSGGSSPCIGREAVTAVSRSLSGQEQALLCAQPLFARAAAAARSLEHPRLRGAVQEAVRRYLNPRRGSIRDALVAVVEVATEGEGRLHAPVSAAAADVAAVAAAAAARCR